MDLATLLGLVGAFAVVAAAILMGGPAEVFINPPSLFIVVGGTALTVLIKFNLSQYLGSLRVAFKAFKPQAQKPQDLIPQICEMAGIARKQGLFALENVEIDYPFLKSAIELVSEGRSPEETMKLLEKDKQEISDRQKLGSQIFTASGDVAPAMGMIGTLIGLVQMLSNMDDPKTIGPAMAVALLTTLYGAVLANMIFMPMADKLKLRRIEEEKLNAICLDGVLGILDGQNPRVIESTLKLYLTPKVRNMEKAEDKQDGGEAPLEQAA
ncbi:MAG: flagellar motor protein PomA [Pseudohongiellaceae bacterium]|jgi:chemotaxis protein MotA